MRAKHREEGCVRVVGISGVVEEPSLIPLATANVRLRRQLSHHPAIGRVDRDRFSLHVLTLNQCLVTTLNEAAEMVVNVVFVVPIVPRQVSIQGFHVVTTPHHERMRAIDVVRSIDVFIHLLRRMLAGVQVLSTEIRQSPVGRQFFNELLHLLGEVFRETGVVLEDDIRIDVFTQALFQNQQVRTVTSPRSIAGSPLRWCCNVSSIDRRKPLGFRKWPWVGQLFQPLAQSIWSAIKVDKKATFNDGPAIQLRRLARMALRGTSVRICGWRC